MLIQRQKILLLEDNFVERAGHTVLKFHVVMKGGLLHNWTIDTYVDRQQKKTT